MTIYQMLKYSPDCEYKKVILNAIREEDIDKWFDYDELTKDYMKTRALEALGKRVYSYYLKLVSLERRRRRDWVKSVKSFRDEDRESVFFSKIVNEIKKQHPDFSATKKNAEVAKAWIDANTSMDDIDIRIFAKTYELNELCYLFYGETK